MDQSVEGGTCLLNVAHNTKVAHPCILLPLHPHNSTAVEKSYIEWGRRINIVALFRRLWHHV